MMTIPVIKNNLLANHIGKEKISGPINNFTQGGQAAHPQSGRVLLLVLL